MAGALKWVGERALLRTFPGDVTAANASAFAAYSALGELALPEVEDLVPGARTLLVVLRSGEESSQQVIDNLERAWVARPPTPGEVREIPVRYGGDDGPDLVEVARTHGLSEPDVVRLHCEAEYVVGFTGFSPGFPYLFGLPDRLVTPRLATPRLRVPAGSVAIGGPYTGVYPQATAGGWRLIGRTDVAMFDPAREPPALLPPGSIVRFVPE